MGSDGKAGMIGHIPIDTNYDVPCTCGDRRHWEAYLSGAGMPNFFAEWKQQHAPNNALGTKEKIEYPKCTKDIFSLANNGDKDAIEFLHDAEKVNMRGISSVIYIYNPDVIIIDGTVAREAMKNRLIDFCKVDEQIKKYVRMPEIRLSKLNGKAPLLGAAVYAKSRQ